jgi:AcrR family transcriptional regulator
MIGGREAPGPSASDDFEKRLEDLLLTEGTSALTVGELAARLRCSRRRLYAIAPSKDALLLHVARGAFTRVRDEGRRVVADEHNAAEAVKKFLAVEVDLCARATDAFASDLAATAAGTNLLRQYMEDRTKDLASLIDAGIAAGTFTKCEARHTASAIVLCGREVVRSGQPSESERQATFAAWQQLIVRGLKGIAAGAT